MRLLIASIIGLVTAACSLSFNPDLPSSTEGDSGGFGSSDESGGDGDGLNLGDGDADGGDGIGLPPTVDGPSEGMGGAHQTCLAGGAGGSSPECEGKP